MALGVGVAAGTGPESGVGVLERNPQSRSGVVAALVQGVGRQPVQGVGMAVQRMGTLEGRPVHRAVVVPPGDSSVDRT